jgi:hypothetical protein
LYSRVGGRREGSERMKPVRIEQERRNSDAASGK